MRKGLHAQSQIWQSFGKEGEEEARRSLPLGGFALFIDPYDHYFNIKPHHFISNQRILIGWMVMINPYKQILTFRV